MPVRGIRARIAVAAVVAVTTSLGLAGCQQDDSSSNPSSPQQLVAADNGGLHQPDESAPSQPPPVISTDVKRGAADLPVDTRVSVSVADGTFDAVRFKVRGTKGALAGRFNADNTAWTAAQLLEPGTDYVVRSRAANSAGDEAKLRSRFSTEALTLDQQTYPSVSPLQHETVGAGMPVIVTFDVPVANRAAFERHMKVTATPATVGSWHWISDQEVHWRPKVYWKAGTHVHVDVDVNGVDAGSGIYGQLSRHVNFKIGKSVVMKTNLSTDKMRVFVNGSLRRTLPITGGKPGYETRSGIKLIIEKFKVKRMDAATVGVDPLDPEYYNIPDVRYAQRVTFSGEFLHAAPWSTYAQGSSNVSHGCVGMSTADAAWLYGITHRGDPVEVTGTNRGLEPGNGWTDWDMSYKDYAKASALN